MQEAVLCGSFHSIEKTGKHKSEKFVLKSSVSSFAIINTINNRSWENEKNVRLTTLCTWDLAVV